MASKAKLSFGQLMATWSRCGPWLASVGSAGFLTLAFPPFGFWLLSFAALTLLLWAITSVDRPVTAGWLGWLCGALFYYGSGWWATHSLIVYGGIPTLIAHILIAVASVLVALPTALFAVGVHITAGREPSPAWVCIPAWWCVSEWLRGEVFAFGWNPLANAVAFEPWLARAAGLGGHYLVGAMIVAFAAGVLSTLRQQPRHPKRVCPGLVAGTLALLLPPLAALLVPLLGQQRPPGGEAQVSVIAVQPCAPMPTEAASTYAEAEARQMRLAMVGVWQAPGDQHRLVIFPESQIALDVDAPGAEAVLQPLLAQDVWVLTNATRRVGEGFANAARLYGPDGSRAEYQKVYLMPFGEYVPLGAYLPVKLPTLAVEARPGKAIVTLPVTDGPQLGVSICFESVFPSLHRAFRRQGATVMVNLANDGWFGQTPGREQHLQHLVYRAIETGCPVVRVTNDGISALLDANGQVQDVMSPGQADVRVWQVVPSAGGSPPYVLVGDVFVWGCMVAVGSLLVWRLWTQLRFYAEAIMDLVAGE
ncbi:MAG: apolipoprotein N-acyltransferase [Acidobacteriota bacterium]